MEVYTCDSVSYVICRNLAFLMLDLETNPFYPVFISASEICEISGHHEEIEKLSKEFGFN